MFAQLTIFMFFSFSIYLLCSLSFSISYFTTKFFNIGFAAIIATGTYFTYLLKERFTSFLPISILIAFLSAILIAIFCEIFVYKKLRQSKYAAMNSLLASLGIYLIIQNLLSLFFGDEPKIINSAETKVGHQFLTGYITTSQIFTIIIALVIFVFVFLLYKYSALGKQIRAVGENSELSNIYGISSNKIILIVTAISSALAAIAGILYAYDTNLTPTMGFNLLLYGIVAMIIGGVGSFRGLLFGSLLLATAQNLVAYYLDTKWMDAATYVILIAFLLWKPLGFSGKHLKKVEI